MSKLRFTDAEKWRDPWYQGLSLIHKALWQYLTDNCDNAGVWVVNHREAEFHLGEAVDWKAALSVFDGRVVALSPAKWHVVKFISFQYPGGLSEKSAPHRQVKRLLAHHGLSLEKEPTCSLHGIESSPKDKDTDTDQDRDTDKDREEDDIGAPSGVVAGTPSDADHWRMSERNQPWARALIKARLPIGRDFWTPWKGLVDDHGLEVVLQFAKNAEPDKRWPGNIEAAIKSSRGQTNPGDRVKSIKLTLS